MAGRLYGYNTMMNLMQLYECAYSLEGADDVPIEVISNDYNAACFSRLYGSRPMGCTALYQVPIFSFSLAVCTSNSASEFSFNNKCLLTDGEIVEYLEDLKRLFKEPSEFTYKISDAQDMLNKSKYFKDVKSCIKITVTLTKTSWFFIKFISHALRFLEEYPSNMVLREAMTLRRKVSQYQSYPILSIFGFVYSAYGCNSHSFTPIPSVGTRRTIIIPYSYKEFTLICNRHDLKNHEVSTIWEAKLVSLSPFDSSRTWTSQYVRDYIDKGDIPEERLKEYNSAFNLVT